MGKCSAESHVGFGGNPSGLAFVVGMRVALALFGRLHPYDASLLFYLGSYRRFYSGVCLLEDDLPKNSIVFWRYRPTTE